MRKENRWRHGKWHFVLPELPEDQRGRNGCRFLSTTFDPDIGEEVYVLFMEDPEYAEQYAEVSPFNLIAHTGLVRTPHGVVAFIVWQIAAGSPQADVNEQYLNPHRMETLSLVSSAASQSHLKLLIINNQTGEVGGFFDFENTFALDELAAAMVSAIGHESEGDFGTAVQHVMNTYSVQELLALSVLDMTGEC